MPVWITFAEVAYHVVLKSSWSLRAAISSSGAVLASSIDASAGKTGGDGVGSEYG